MLRACLVADYEEFRSRSLIGVTNQGVVACAAIERGCAGACNEVVVSAVAINSSRACAALDTFEVGAEFNGLTADFSRLPNALSIDDNIAAVVAEVYASIADEVARNVTAANGDVLTLCCDNRFNAFAVDFKELFDCGACGDRSRCAVAVTSDDEVATVEGDFINVVDCENVVRGEVVNRRVAFVADNDFSSACAAEFNNVFACASVNSVALTCKDGVVAFACLEVGAALLLVVVFVADKNEVIGEVACVECAAVAASEANDLILALCVEDVDHR